MHTPSEAKARKHCKASRTWWTDKPFRFLFHFYWVSASRYLKSKTKQGNKFFPFFFTFSETRVASPGLKHKNWKLNKLEQTNAALQKLSHSCPPIKLTTSRIGRHLLFCFRTPQLLDGRVQKVPHTQSCMEKCLETLQTQTVSQYQVINQECWNYMYSYLARPNCRWLVVWLTTQTQRPLVYKTPRLLLYCNSDWRRVPAREKEKNLSMQKQKITVSTPKVCMQKKNKQTSNSMTQPRPFQIQYIAVLFYLHRFQDTQFQKEHTAVVLRRSWNS